MRSLRELQSDCYRAFLLDAPEVLLPRLVSNAIPAAARVRVYQNNVRETFRQTLAASYPVVERLVGDACFRALARSYMREHPSSSGDLLDFAERFAEFLAKQYAGSAFDYLPDVARLEWAIESVLVSAEGAALHVTDLGLVDPGMHTAIVLEPGSGVRLVESRYPILDVWRANQPGQERDVDLATGAQHVLVRRRGYEAELRLLDPAAAQLARVLGRGASLGEACHLLGSSPGFDLARALAVLLGHGCFSGFSVKPGA